MIKILGYRRFRVLRLIIAEILAPLYFYYPVLGCTKQS